MGRGAWLRARLRLPLGRLATAVSRPDGLVIIRNESLEASRVTGDAKGQLFPPIGDQVRALEDTSLDDRYTHPEPAGRLVVVRARPRAPTLVVADRGLAPLRGKGLGSGTTCALGTPRGVFALVRGRAPKRPPFTLWHLDGDACARCARRRSRRTPT